MKYFNSIFFVLITSLILTSCEKEVEINIPENESNIVVEGIIETGAPPLVLLTKSQKYFGAQNINDLNNLIISGAQVIVREGNIVDTLQEVCLSNLPPNLQVQIKQQLGIDAVSSAFDFCAYTSFSGKIIGRAMGIYSLEVNYNNKKINAVTSIPNTITIDSLYVKTNIVEENDSLVRAYFIFKDPINQKNFYRYYTKRNSEAFYPDKFQSSFDDAVINGTTFNGPINRGEPRSKEFEPNTYGFFNKGDTIILKWCSIDEAHYNFWHTYENDNSGPFSSYVRIQTNINGGLGIWGGLAPAYDTIIVPR